eukprot:3847471-Amphidinium_carterae.1
MPAIRKTDPTRWSQHVVRALGSRLPGGIASVTTPCEVCQSVFYPCLCSVEDQGVPLQTNPEEPKRPHQQGLRAPRIVQVAEHERLSSEGRHPGHLDLVQQGNDDIYMDKTTLEFMKAGAKDDDGNDVPLGSARILYRHGRHYVIQTEGDKKDSETQKLKLKPSDLKDLKMRMDLNLMIDKEADHHREEVQRSAGMKEFDHREVIYEDDKEAFNDMKLVLIQHGGISRYIVQEVCKGGIAHVAGIRKGHELLQVWDGSSAAKGETRVSERHIPGIFLEDDKMDNMSGSQSPVPLTRSVTLPMGPAATQASGTRGWPCRLVFSALPRGWKATSVTTMQELDRLADGDAEQEVSVEFQYLPMRVITR